MRMVAVCLRPGDDLRTAIEAVVREYKITAGTVISCVGALKSARLRMAGTGREQQDIHDFAGPFEILSLVGNVGQGRTHLHLTVADRMGKVIGGHLKDGGTIIDITAELVVAVEDRLRFTEHYDAAVGWDNLVIEEAA